MIKRNHKTENLQDDVEYFNPARRHLKKTQKKQGNPIQAQSNHANTELQCRFRDVSTSKQGWNTELKEAVTPSMPSNNTKNAALEFSSIRRKLRFQQDNTVMSKRSSSKSLTFSDVIRLSRQKKQHELSKAKASIEMNKSLKALNKLKNRLLGQNIEKQNIIKSAIQKSSKMQMKGIRERREEEMDAVRVSMSFTGEDLQKSLDMSPMFN